MKRERPGLPPVKVQLAVAYRQYLRVTQDVATSFANVAAKERRAGATLEHVLGLLQADLGGALDLDHDPALRTRMYWNNPRLDAAARYSPHAHHPNYLRYRPKAPEAKDSHHIKTFVRGDHGQFSDVSLINREKNRERKKSGARAGARFPRSRKLQSANRWPPKGSRKIRSRGWR